MITGENHMRDDAVSFGLPEGEAGNILAMVNYGDTMEVFTENSTFKIVSPDTIDPKRNHQNTPWIHTKTSDFGASNSIVANTVLLVDDFLNQLLPAEDVKRLSIINKVRDIRNVLLECLLSLQSYIDELNKEIQKFEMNNNVMNGKAHAYFPQIKNLDGFTTSFLIAAKRSIQETAVLVSTFIPLKDKHGRVNSLLKEVESEYAHAKKLIAVLREHLPMCTHISSLRNAQEHAATRDLPLIVDNFNIENGYELLPPRWGIKGNPFNFIHTEASDVLNFLIIFFEDVFLSCVTFLFPDFPVYNISFNDKPDEQIPIRYSLHISLPDTFFNKGS